MHSAFWPLEARWEERGILRVLSWLVVLVGHVVVLGWVGSEVVLGSKLAQAGFGENVEVLSVDLVEFGDVTRLELGGQSDTDGNALEESEGGEAVHQAAAPPSGGASQAVEAVALPEAKQSALRAPRRPQERVGSFDPSRISALLDKSPTQSAPVKQEVRRRVGATKLSLNEVDGFKAQMRGCWTIPAGAAWAEKLSVEVRVRLTEDGYLAAPAQVVGLGVPDSPFMRVAVAGALRALERCQPFRMPKEKYAQWQELHLNFDAAAALGAKVR